MELFDIDSQTLSDLEIFGSAKHEVSVFSFFNFTSTIGGRDKLLSIFKTPQTDAAVITLRLELIAYLQHSGVELYFRKESMDFIAFYLQQKVKPKPLTRYNRLKTALSYLSGATQEQYLRQRGIAQLFDLLLSLDLFCTDLDAEKSPPLLVSLRNTVSAILNYPIVRKHLKGRALNRFALAECDYICRYLAVEEIDALLEIIYELDAYVSVARAAAQYKLCYPILNTSGPRKIEIKEVFHLFIKKPIANSIDFSYGKNVCFLTGANMAGKSTFLKSVAIAIYLAHLGFPVPAQDMELSIFRGLTTTINLPDNLSQGYSHFYNEVRRVKEVAQKITSARNMVVIFDELFSGTNVKDAYDGSLAIISAFSRIRDSFFMISTHIAELAAALKHHDNVNFCYMPSSLAEGLPQFSYLLQEGVTEERMGMWIIENEGIIDLLHAVKVDPE